MGENKQAITPQNAKYAVIGLSVLALLFYLFLPAFSAGGVSSGLFKVFSAKGVVFTIILIIATFITAALQVVFSIIKPLPFGVKLPAANAILVLLLGLTAPSPLTMGTGLILALICYVIIAAFNAYYKKTLI